jgi:hypothetical protein
MYSNIDEQERWVKIGQQLLWAMGPVERTPQSMRRILDTLAPMPQPRTYHFGRHLQAR